MSERTKSFLWVMLGIIIIGVVLYLVIHFWAPLWYFIKMIFFSILVILLLLAGLGFILWGLSTLD